MFFIGYIVDRILKERYIMKEKKKSDILQKLGKNIKQIRLLKGLTQENVANDLQTSINFVSLLENGKCGISIETIVNLCKVLDIDANTLFANIINPTDITTDDFIKNSINLLEENDKTIILDLINYIVNSKN